MRSFLHRQFPATDGDSATFLAGSTLFGPQALSCRRQTPSGRTSSLRPWFPARARPGAPRQPPSEVSGFQTRRRQHRRSDPLFLLSCRPHAVKEAHSISCFCHSLLFPSVLVFLFIKVSCLSVPVFQVTLKLIVNLLLSRLISIHNSLHERMAHDILFPIFYDTDPPLRAGCAKTATIRSERSSGGRCGWRRR